MLRRQPRIFSVRAEVLEAQRAPGDDGQTQRAAQDLPAAFAVRTIDDENICHLLNLPAITDQAVNPSMMDIDELFVASGLRNAAKICLTLFPEKCRHITLSLYSHHTKKLFELSTLEERQSTMSAGHAFTTNIECGGGCG
jgi:hypothetical protein